MHRLIPMRRCWNSLNPSWYRSNLHLNNLGRRISSRLAIYSFIYLFNSKHSENSTIECNNKINKKSDKWATLFFDNLTHSGQCSIIVLFEHFSVDWRRMKWQILTIAIGFVGNCCLTNHVTTDVFVFRPVEPCASLRSRSSGLSDWKAVSTRTAPCPIRCRCLANVLAAHLKQRTKKLSIDSIDTCKLE